MFSFTHRFSILKYSVYSLLFLLIAGWVSNVYAQNNVDTIDSLAVDIWPEYDRASVLVLLTGFLPDNAQVPATITIPVPEGADINAVARITEDGSLFSDIDFDESVSGQVTLTTPDPRFRIEYYMPYTLEGDTRSFRFEWEADFDVTELLISVQQPVGTSDLTTDPAEFSVTTRQDGFQYHNLSPVSVAAGDAFSLQVEYSRAMTQLSAELLEPVASSGTTTNSTPGTTEGTSSGSGLDLPTILLASGGVAVLAVGVWMIFGERLMAARKAPVKSRPASTPTRPKRRAPEPEMETMVRETPTYVQFCHHCGQKSDPDDRFCRSCGTRLKT